MLSAFSSRSSYNAPRPFARPQWHRAPPLQQDSALLPQQVQCLPIASNESAVPGAFFASFCRERSKREGDVKRSGQKDYAIAGFYLLRAGASLKESPCFGPCQAVCTRIAVHLAPLWWVLRASLPAAAAARSPEKTRARLINVFSGFPERTGGIPSARFPLPRAPRTVYIRRIPPDRTADKKNGPSKTKKTKENRKVRVGTKPALGTLLGGALEIQPGTTGPV